MGVNVQVDIIQCYILGECWPYQIRVAEVEAQVVTIRLRLIPQGIGKNLSLLMCMSPHGIKSN